MSDTLAIKSLPKWPQMLVYGERVKFDQVMEIIRRTDRLFGPMRNGDSMGGQRFHKFEAAVCRGMGLPCGRDQYRHDGTDEGFEKAIKRASRIARAWDKYRKAVDYVETDYVHNDLLASCFYAGPYGWCSPTGGIFYGDNIGKWPTRSEVLSDWTKLARAFPYLNLEVALMTGEGCENDTSQALAITVEKGKATLRGHDYKTFERFGSSVEEMKVFNAGFSAGRSVFSASNDGMAFTAEQVLRLVVPEFAEAVKKRRYEAREKNRARRAS